MAVKNNLTFNLRAVLGIVTGLSVGKLMSGHGTAWQQKRTRCEVLVTCGAGQMTNGVGCGRGDRGVV